MNNNMAMHYMHVYYYSLYFNAQNECFLIVCHLLALSKFKRIAIIWNSNFIVLSFSTIAIGMVEAHVSYII